MIRNLPRSLMIAEIDYNYAFVNISLSSQPHCGYPKRSTEDVPGGVISISCHYHGVSGRPRISWHRHGIHGKWITEGLPPEVHGMRLLVKESQDGTRHRFGDELPSHLEPTHNTQRPQTRKCVCRGWVRSQGTFSFWTNCFPKS